jgi:hypothetical protein
MSLELFLFREIGKSRPTTERPSEENSALRAQSHILTFEAFHCKGEEGTARTPSQARKESNELESMVVADSLGLCRDRKCFGPNSGHIYLPQSATGLNLLFVQVTNAK